jgi:hypothetical protein
VKKPKDLPAVINPNWRIMVDERTQMKFSAFFAKKNLMVEPTCVQLNKWKNADKAVKFIRMDNAGENKLLQTRLESAAWKLDIQYEYTARDTPQQNHLAELGFAVLGNRGRALLYRANVPRADRFILWRDAFQTATLLDGLMMIKIDGMLKTR